MYFIIALMMEAVRISETSVHFNVATRRYIPQDSKLQKVLSYRPYKVTVFITKADMPQKTKTGRTKHVGGPQVENT
jgi:hypothetical protein